MTYECSVCHLRVDVVSDSAQITCRGGHRLDDPHRATTMRRVDLLPLDVRHA